VSETAASAPLGQLQWRWAVAGTGAVALLLDTETGSAIATGCGAMQALSSRAEPSQLELNLT
jgi:hypothetical protein